ncbi:proline-rich protein 3-like [Mercurialis annua]|uniref:proline-rich protein 3-like n=1 Tax=Mercurialis annua TaxID=3986 RepID=UPI0024AE3D3B|nr:proline-rich protein 3-like [Mercurialis annua]
MAFGHLLFSSSILLLSFLVIASASDYDYASKSKPDYVKPQNDYNPIPQLDSVKLENEYNARPRLDIPKPDTNYAPKAKFYTAKPEETYIPKSELEYVKFDTKHTENPNFNYPKSKPEYVKLNEKYNPNPKRDIAKPDVTYPKLESKLEKLKHVVTYPESKPQYVKSNQNYSPESKQDTVKPKLEENNNAKYNLDASYPEQKSEYVKPDLALQKLEVSIPNSGYGYTPKLETPLHIGIEGLILCKSGSSYVPIKGALAKISCSILGENGYMTRLFSCSTGATDAKGYFFKALPIVGLKDCNVKLEKSSLEKCNIPTDVNKGITGAHVSSYQILSDKRLKLYSVGPFFYTSEPKPITPSTGY